MISEKTSEKTTEKASQGRISILVFYMQKSHHGTVEIEWHKRKKIEAFPMLALRIATKPVEVAPKVASVYQKATKSQTPKTSTPPKKAPFGCILSSMAPSNGARGGVERYHKSLCQIFPNGSGSGPAFV
jgi:hypothetical protein